MNFSKTQKTLLFIVGIVVILLLLLFASLMESDNIKEKDVGEIVSEKEKEEQTLEITAAGDIMFHMPIVNAYFDGENYDFKPIFRYVKPIIEESDISIFNLETTIFPEGEYSGYPNFNSPEQVLDAIKFAGFNFACLSNNHSYDSGKDGVISTMDAVEKRMDHIGTNKTAEDERTRIIEKNGFKIGVMNYTYGLNGHIQESDYLVNVIDIDKMKEDIEYLKSNGAEKIILFIHWGSEYVSEVSDELETFGEELLDSGVDYILGSHPHVISPLRYYGEDRQKFIAYSMGNFLSNQRFEYLGYRGVEDGLIVKFVLKRDVDTEEVFLDSVKTIPVWVNKYRTDRFNFEIIPIEDALNGNLKDFELNENLKEELQNSLERTNSILSE